MVRSNIRSWEECLPFVEFAYNYSVHSSHGFSPFEIVYGFKPLTPLDLLPLPLHEITNLDGQKKANLVKEIHEKAQKRFLSKKKLKLDVRGDGPFKVLEKIIDNAYKIDLPGDYNVSVTFNVSNLSSFDDADLHSRVNAFEERGNDARSKADPMDHAQQEVRPAHYEVLNDFPMINNRSITRSKLKQLKSQV
ncbi:uncharacterized protein LOC131174438 [Hevea brasiliensis]|uniref:uncharacterized protein LOC131174438 n=1 Tax=Hevea brasiliensis TaxID=3981 RepID=UPI0025E26C66|nr:uncharacterized protein LOC131174438 [Hevea brasiliensis]